MKTTTIGWTDLSANPLKYRDNTTGQTVWHCVKTSPGCANCYSETLANRYGRGGPYTRQKLQTVTPFMDSNELRRIATAERVDGEPVAGKRCFAFDMTDLFGDWIPDGMIDAFFAAASCNKQVTFQVLTKRTARAREYLSNLYADIVTTTVPRLRAAAEAHRFAQRFNDVHAAPVFETPLPNVWVGGSIENNDMLLARADDISHFRAAVRFWSVEPLIGELRDLESKLGYWHKPPCETCRATAGRFNLECPACNSKNATFRRAVDWIIIGGESGPGSRPMPEAAAMNIIDATRPRRIPTFFKQAGTILAKTWSCTGKGEKPTEWPSHFRVQEFPT